MTTCAPPHLAKISEILVSSLHALCMSCVSLEIVLQTYLQIKMMAKEVEAAAELDQSGSYESFKLNTLAVGDLAYPTRAPEI